MKRWLQIWQRGWCDEDLDSVLAKMRRASANHFVHLTAREMRAHVAYMRERGAKSVFAV